MSQAQYITPRRYPQIWDAVVRPKSVLPQAGAAWDVSALRMCLGLYWRHGSVFPSARNSNSRCNGHGILPKQRPTPRLPSLASCVLHPKWGVYLSIFPQQILPRVQGRFHSHPLMNPTEYLFRVARHEHCGLCFERATRTRRGGCNRIAPTCSFVR